ncbi:GTPase FZO1 [Metarhizium album ARSEF 1941]|uniref:GTPase FZO1 n=1 Tax=Metarhizium album (strain ARSEF 1941) TaxID=1081103 RepID=A0A0B2WGD3_METAS|nr:GTPase FZO1 [Metarhizium album ARSEF 1941]KHN95066.1 GTPase FZO1 [Metarhizium album ARSEF 1941]
MHAIFCEVLNASKTSGFALLEDPEQVVVDSGYTQCKVFASDLQTADESLLGNKKVEAITLIDAPGLNYHTTRTTAVLARQ